jgi:hypothetical protein
MNEYIKDMFDTFGGQSDEYMRTLRQVRENLPDSVLQQTTRQGLNYVADRPTEPLQFSRGKKSQEILQNFETDLSNLRKEQRETGTAAVQAQPYYLEQQIEAQEKGQPANVSKKLIKEQAEDRYYFNSNVNDWYDEINNAEELTELEKQDIKADYSNLNENYWEVGARSSLQEKAEKLIDKIRQRRSQQSTGIPTPKNPNIKGVGADFSKL